MQILSDQEIERIADSFMEYFRDNYRDTRAMPEYELINFVREIEAEIIKKVREGLGW